MVTPSRTPATTAASASPSAGPVGTYFARVFGMNQITAQSTSKAEFTLPVPMGSPQNYYGVGYLVGATTHDGGLGDVDPAPASEQHPGRHLVEPRQRGHGAA